MNVWKALGLAGLAGVASAGVIIAREQRQRTQLAPEDIRARLHERLEQVQAGPAAPPRGSLPEAPVRGATGRRWQVPQRYRVRPFSRRRT
jgi:hypothetical protein